MHVLVNMQNLPDVVSLFLCTALFGALTTIEYNQLAYIMDALKQGDHKILAIQKEAIERIYKKIQERRERALAFGFNLMLSQADEHDMAWAYQENKEMEAYYNNYNNTYIDQLKRNFKWKAAGHGTIATVLGLVTAMCGYGFCKELKSIFKKA